MNSYPFQIVAGTDKEYVDAFDSMKAESEFVYERISLDYRGYVGPEGVSTNQGFVEVLAQGERVIPSTVAQFSGNWSVHIQRSKELNSPFDTVIVNRPNSPQDALRFAELTALFVATAYFFIRWNNQWFQRHANEEFRLKRMELDIDRASWFVEMAFEWKDEKGEEIPEALIERLTQGLFNDEGGDHAVEPAESLAHALMGAARFKVKLSGQIEVEYDRKGVEKLLKEEKQRKNNEKPKK